MLAAAIGGFVTASSRVAPVSTRVANPIPDARSGARMNARTTRMANMAVIPAISPQAARRNALLRAGLDPLGLRCKANGLPPLRTTLSAMASGLERHIWSACS